MTVEPTLDEVLARMPSRVGREAAGETLKRSDLEVVVKKARLDRALWEDREKIAADKKAVAEKKKAERVKAKALEKEKGDEG